MKKIIILSILILSFSCNKKPKSRNLSTIENKSEKVDTIIKNKPKEASFINNDSKTRVNNWLKIDTLGNDGYKVSEYLGGFEPYNLKRIMFKRKLKETPLESLAFGQWFFFTGDFGSLYSTGFYKEGVKDSIWVNVFDDYPIPKLMFYKNGELTDFKGKVNVNDHKGRPWIIGQDIIHNNIPKGLWKEYRYDIDLVSVYQFMPEKDSIKVLQKQLDIKTKKVMEEYDYYVPYENEVLYDYR